MTKRVVNSQQVAHLWANQSQSDARNSGRTFSFCDDLLYSYSTPIGRIVKSPRTGESVALLSGRSYSVTTAKQQGYAARAASHLPSFRVPFLGVDYIGRHNESRAGNFHEGNAGYLIEKYRANVARLARMRSRPWGDVRERLQSERDEIAQYAALFDIGNKGRAELRKVNVRADVATIEAAHARREARESDPKHQEKLARAAARRAERRTAADELRRIEHERRREELRQQEAAKVVEVRAVISDGGYLRLVEAWRRGELNSLEPRYAYLLTREERDAAGMNHGPLMRIRGQEIETSQGARVPVSDIAPALALVRGIWERGETYAAGPDAVRLGGFSLMAVTPTVVKVGCHTFERAEVERLADSLAALTLTGALS